MIMADVFAVFGTLLAVGIALPGLLLTWRLLLPNVIARAQQRLEQTPWRCLFVGGFALPLYLIPVIILFNLPWGVFKAMGAGATFILLALTSLGAAGLAGFMGQRLQSLGLDASTIGATVRGAVAMELAAAFPLIGWFIFIPLTFIASFGATVLAFISRIPRPTKQPASTQDVQEIPLSA